MRSGPRAAVILRAAGLIASVALYAAVVSRPAQDATTAADRLGCVDAHAVGVQALMMAGLLAGWIFGETAVRWVTLAAQALLPWASDQRRRAYVRAVAFAAIAGGGAVNFLWVNPAVNLFIDVHRPLFVEASLLVYLMGVAGGAAWFLLLDWQGWLGFLVTPAMALMLVSAGVVGRGWC